MARPDLTPHQKKPSRQKRHTGTVCPESGIWHARVQLPLDERRSFTLPSIDPRLRYFMAGKILPEFRSRAVVWRLDQHDKELSDREREFAMNTYNSEYLEYSTAVNEAYRQMNKILGINFDDAQKDKDERERAVAEYDKARADYWNQLLRKLRETTPWR
jgi:hypothetical protein